MPQPEKTTTNRGRGNDSVMPWQAIDGQSRGRESVSFQISYRDPTTKEEDLRDVELEIIVGRDPGPDGLVLGRDNPDFTISAQTIAFRDEGQLLNIANVGRFRPIEIQHATGSSVVSPGTELRVPGPVKVVIPGENLQHELDVKFLGSGVGSVSSGATRKVVPVEYSLPHQRLPVLALLCAPHFYPSRFGAALMTAREISQMLERRGTEVTPKAVNSKIQRTKEGLESKFGAYLERREDLVRFLIEHQIVTQADVDDTLGDT